MRRTIEREREWGGVGEDAVPVCMVLSTHAGEKKMDSTTQNQQQKNNTIHISGCHNEYGRDPHPLFKPD